TAVPVSAVPDFIKKASDAVLDILPEADCVPFGHLGDGNIHFNVRKPAAMSDDVFRRLWPSLSQAIEKSALDLGGTISAEHGIGRLKQSDFSAFSSPAELQLMTRLKRMLDPAEVMNPGAIFPYASNR
ncbi:MAG: hypothetical protein K8F25_01055, partial [Fimbriimonadaceae bacterium]|nr:hypothetical protein [Alphaproteobacteria bacterium]